MKKNLLFAAFAVLFALGKTTAQNYIPVATTGYTLDAVAENTTAIATTASPIDNSDFVLYSQYYGALYSPSAVGLPNNGLITSGTRTYQLQSYSAPNVLHVKPNLKDSLTFVTPQAFPVLSLLSFGTQGIATVSITVRFTDNTTQVFSPVTFDDWFNTSTAIISGFDRTLRTTGAPALVGSAGNPKMFGADLNILCANQGKQIWRVIVQNNSTAFACVMAVSGKVPAYSVSPSSPLACSGSNVTLNATGMTTYTWQPVGTFAGSNSGTITVSPAATTQYTLLGESGGCPGYTVVTVNVSSGSPTVSLAGSTQTVCLGAAATITASGALAYTLTSPAANGGTFAPNATAVYTITGGNGCGTNSVTTTITVTPLQVSVSTPTTLVCASTAATLNASGATTYTWMPGNSTQTTYVTSPAANTIYTVTGKTGNCLGVNTITISTTPNPTMMITASTPTVCSGNSANLTVTGNALTYTWSTATQQGPSITVNPTNSTLYSVTGTNASGCKTTMSQPILVSPLPVMNATASNTLVCTGESLTLTATGAATYMWSDNTAAATNIITSSSSTVYTVTGTSNANCVNSTTVAVNVLLPVLSVSNSTAVCKGTNVNLSASGTDAFLWSTGSAFSSINVTPIATTIYSVEGTSSLDLTTCTTTAAITVSVNPNPTVTAVASPTFICKGNSSVLDAGGAGTGANYTWATPSNTVSQSLTVTPSADQNYTVTGEDANGCKGTRTVLVKVSGCVGIAGNEPDALSLLIYPNPSNGSVNVKSDISLNLTVINELGQPVKTLKLDDANGHQAVIDGLAAGIYFITSQDNAAHVKQKIVITK